MDPAYHDPGKAKDEAMKYLQRGDYYLKQKNYKQAVEDYGRSMGHFWWCFNMLENLESSRMMDVTSTTEQKIDFIFFIGNLVHRIAGCYERLGELRKANIFVRDLKRIIKALEVYQNEFDIEQIKKYQELNRSTAITELAGNAKEIMLEGQVKDQLPNNSDYADKTFSSIRDNFDGICRLEICMLSSGTSTISEDASSSIKSSSSSILSIDKDYGYVILVIGILFFLVGKPLGGSIFIAIFLGLLLTNSLK